MEKKIFAKGLCFDKLVWIFAISSLIGYCIEEIWCLIKNGYFESRKSLVYGHLSVIYGMGAVILTLALNRFSGDSFFKIFLVAFLTGTLTEYIASLGQEIVFGSVAWDYSGVPLNINGRVCIPYSLFWGILGYVWIKFIYPFMSTVIEKIPYRTGKIITACFLIYFIFDCFMSASAGLRMVARANGKGARNSFEKFLDRRFTDERMHNIYANSKSV